MATIRFPGKISLRLLPLLCIASFSVCAQDFSGTYQLEGSDTPATLTFRSEGWDAYSGTLGNANFTLTLDGEIAEDVLVGMINDGSDSLVFVAAFREPSLMLTLMELDFFGEPIEETVEVLEFSRSGAGSAPARQPRNTAVGNVSVNGRTLNAADLAGLENMYGFEPLPGDYWYDTVSGLYGVVGYPAFGFMLPGHDFPALESRASNGNTNVYINGREIPQAEWLVWSAMLGSPIFVGSYWLDAYGNAGYQGNPIPLVNLYQAAQQNAYAYGGGQGGYAGGGGGGDNFWSSRFSAGNSSADGSQGYVSVPGYGPVGYGF